ncbi:hypothetical protein ACOME3_007180 [Neoechinorhynchus agilis]
MRMYNIELKDANSPVIYCSMSRNETKSKKLAFPREVLTVLPTTLDHIQGTRILLSVAKEIGRINRSKELSLNLILKLYADVPSYTFERLTKFPLTGEEWEKVIMPTKKGLIDGESEVLQKFRKGIISEAFIHGVNISTTLKSTESEFDLERMEYLGDSLLKVVVSIHCFCAISAQLSNEHVLSIERTKLINNEFLHKRGVELNLAEYLATQSVKHYSTTEFEFLLWVDSSPQKRKMKCKRLSDSVEAILGMFHLATRSMSETVKLCSIILGQPLLMDSPEVNFVNDFDNPIQCLKTVDGLWQQSNLNEMEAKLGYEFKRRKLLIEAITHPSAMMNNLTPCYERLEFLGDAVIDYFAACYGFQNFVHFTPDKLTNFRQYLVSNKLMATVSVLSGVYKHLMFSTQSIQSETEIFIGSLNEVSPENMELSKFDYTLLEKDGYLGCPKYLADIIESSIGAVFIDSDHSFEVTWNCFYSLFKYAIDSYQANHTITS